MPLVWAERSAAMADLAGIVHDTQAARGWFLVLRHGDRAVTCAELPPARDSA
jgi:hypothetical protein